jgi:hypothetical protein
MGTIWVTRTPSLPGPRRRPVETPPNHRGDRIGRVAVGSSGYLFACLLGKQNISYLDNPMVVT